MKIGSWECHVRGLRYTVRSAREEDASSLSAVRLQIDGETENMDREPGEGFIDEEGFVRLVRGDAEKERNLFLVAEAEGKIVGFSRCQGFELNRMRHKVEFGICILKDYWGYGIGSKLLQASIRWADASGVVKMCLHVLETNTTAIALYEKYGFRVEGVLKQDKRLSDGGYYDTVVMGRIHSSPMEDSPAITMDDGR